MAEQSKLVGTRRPLVGDAERERLESIGGVAVDRGRSRARYFDGRFLTARDLTGDQQYVVRRQVDLGRAAGTGVVEGLEVRRGPQARVHLSPGLGMTPAGETVVLSGPVVVDLIGLRDRALLLAHQRRGPQKGPTQRNGAFLLGLRPVEVRTEPRKGYPTEVHGQRATEDHTYQEFTEVVLVPWRTGPAAGGPEAVRRGLVRDLFTHGPSRGGPADLLPLALVYLSGGEVSWIDEPLVRRQLGAEQADGLGLGLGSRGLRVAHVRQYGRQIREILRGRPRELAAADHFDVLPPVGEIPLSALDPKQLSQGFFPPEIDVDLSIVPEDEIAAVVEDALMLPPIDLAAELVGVSVLVLLPARREEVRVLRRSLETVRRFETARFSPGLRVREKPRETSTSAWSAVVGQAAARLGDRGLVWFVRRRNLNFGTPIPGFVAPIDLLSLPAPVPAEVFERRVTATAKDQDGDILDLVNANESWLRVSSAEAIAQIEAGTHSYYVLRGGIRTDVAVVVGPTRKFLRTDADRTGQNNLDNLPDP